MNVTIKDVAKHANVSVATVSRVINGLGSVDEGLRNRVEKAIQELGFMPNHVARSLKMSATNTIGVAVSDISNPFFTTIAKEIENVIRKKSYSMLMVSTDSDIQKEKENISLFESKRVDGIIVSPDSDEIAEFLRSIKTPTVAIDRKTLKNICDSVYVDKEKSMYDIACYLFNKGHRNIGMVTGPKDLSTNYDRFNGFIKAHYDNGIPLDNENILFGKFDTKFGKDAFAQLFSKENHPTAIVAGSALIATGFLIQAKNMNVKIPEEVSVVSFGSVGLEELIDLKITYITELRSEIGQIAGDMILERIKHPDKPIDLRILQGTIIEGNSVKSFQI